MPSLARTTQGPLGCGTYSVQVINDGRPILESKRVTSALWNRRLDEVSTSTITIPVQGNDLRACCESSQLIEPHRSEVIIRRDSEPVWQGWLMNDISIRRDAIMINAHDILGWMERRVLGTHVHVATDLTDIALDYINDVNSPGDLPFAIQSTPSGVVIDRTVLASEDRYGWDAMREILDIGLDATVVAGVLYLGAEVATCGTLVLRDTDLDGDPEVKLDGRQRATRVIVKGANGIRSEYPPVPPTVCYHHSDFVHSDESIIDQAAADAAAINLYERMSSSYPYYLSIPQGSALRPTAAVHINALVPGNIVQVKSDALCVPINMAMRLTAVDVDVQGSSEQVRITLEPLGDNEGI